MTTLLLAQRSNNLLDLVSSINGDILGAVLILGTIGFFITAIVTVVTVCSSITNLKIVKMHHRLVSELLKQGYSADDIERLTVGQGLSGQVKKLCRAATKRMRSAAQSTNSGNHPAPPIKQPA